MEIVSPEFTKIIEQLTGQVTLENCVDAEEFRVFKEVNALPIGYDLYSFVFLKSNGEVIWFNFLDDVFGSDSSLQGLIGAVVSASRRYPQIEKFIPERPENAEVCIACNGAKVLGKDISTKQPARCVICAGLGWTIVEENKL